MTRYADGDMDRDEYSMFVGPFDRWETCGNQRRQSAYQRAPIKNIL